MNIIESVQKKYLPNFYESRYSARKRLALSLKEKCLNHPAELTLYELKIILKVLQQFGLLQKDPGLKKMEKELKGQVLQNSVWSSIAGLVPWGVREFYKMGILKRLAVAGVIFCVVDYSLMHPHFMKYLEQCRKVAQKQINKLTQDCELLL